MEKRRRRKYNKKRLILTGISLLLVIIIIVSVIFIKTQKATETTIQYDKQRQEETSNLLGDISLLSEADKSLLDDYQLVVDMLMRQDMSTYSEEALGKIQMQADIVKQKQEAQDLSGLEEAVNTLAATIDYPLFTGESGDLFYTRGILILNKEHSAPANFEPGNRTIMTNAFSEMQKAAQNDGINLYDFSNYRSYYSQEVLYNRYVAADGQAAADRYSAKPGTSEHQTGFVMDIGGDNQAAWAETTFDNTKEAKWLAEHAHEYGFILRYPQGKEDITGYMYESWHFRYVGGIATNVYESGLSLEEYLELA